jgi:hypothetical protein
VTFINSDALHALLEVCASMSVQVTAISPEVDRVLGLTGAREFVVGSVQ